MPKRKSARRARPDPKRVHQTEVRLRSGELARPADGVDPRRLVPHRQRGAKRLGNAEKVQRQLGVGFRRRLVTQEIQLFRDNQGRAFFLPEETGRPEGVGAHLLHIADPFSPQADFKRIAKYAARLLDKFGLPYAGKRFRKRDAHGSPDFYFWEIDNQLKWGVHLPVGVSGVRSSYVSEEMADRIVVELTNFGDEPFSEAYEIPYALAFLESVYLGQAEKDAWRQSTRPVAPEAALDSGFGLGLELGAILQEWRLARDPTLGRAILREQKAARNRPPPPRRPKTLPRKEIFRLAKKILSANPRLSRSEVARRVASKLERKIGGIRNYIGEIWSKLHAG